MTFVASRQQFDRCECCGRRFPARALDMDRRQLWRSDMLGMDPATHSYLAGADLDDEVDHALETARLFLSDCRRPWSSHRRALRSTAEGRAST